MSDQQCELGHGRPSRAAVKFAVDSLASANAGPAAPCPPTYRRSAITAVGCRTRCFENSSRPLPSAAAVRLSTAGSDGCSCSRAPCRSQAGLPPVSGGRSPAALHRARKARAAYLRGAPQRSLSRRVPKRVLVCKPGGRSLADFATTPNHAHPCSSPLHRSESLGPRNAHGLLVGRSCRKPLNVRTHVR